MTKIKICGLRDAKNAIAAADAGVDFLGFNFVEGVRRQLREDEAEAILQEYRSAKVGSSPKLVGLFANQPLEFVNTIVHRFDLDHVQLCGDEPSDYCSGVDATVIRQIRVRDGGDRQRAADDVLTQVDQVVSQGHIALLDKHEAGALGGTGRVFDWSIAREVAERFDVLLAGGLSPGNVAEAISTVRPWGVDVSSGVETDGVKDVEKIRRFASQVIAADSA